MNHTKLRKNERYTDTGRLNQANHYLPLLDHGSNLIGSQSHTMKVSQNILAANIFRNQTELPKAFIAIKL